MANTRIMLFAELSGLNLFFLLTYKIIQSLTEIIITCGLPLLLQLWGNFKIPIYFSFCSIPFFIQLYALFEQLNGQVILKSHLCVIYANTWWSIILFFLCFRGGWPRASFFLNQELEDDEHVPIWFETFSYHQTMVPTIMCACGSYTLWFINHATSIQGW